MSIIYSDCAKERFVRDSIVIVLKGSLNRSISALH